MPITFHADKYAHVEEVKRDKIAKLLCDDTFQAPDTPFLDGHARTAGNS